MHSFYPAQNMTRFFPDGGYNIGVYFSADFFADNMFLTASIALSADGIMHGVSLLRYILLMRSIVNLSDHPLISAWMHSL